MDKITNIAEGEKNCPIEDKNEGTDEAIEEGYDGDIEEDTEEDTRGLFEEDMRGLFEELKSVIQIKIYEIISLLGHEKMTLERLQMILASIVEIQEAISYILGGVSGPIEEFIKLEELTKSAEVISTELGRQLEARQERTDRLGRTVDQLKEPSSEWASSRE